MSLSIDLSTNGKEIKHLYDTIVSNDPQTSWAVFNYVGTSNTLRIFDHGGMPTQLPVHYCYYYYHHY